MTDLTFGPVTETERRTALAYLTGAREAAMLGVPAHPPPSAVGVAGAGTMGTGIGVAFAAAGVPVVVYEPQAAVRERAAQRMQASLERWTERARRSGAEPPEPRLSLTADRAALASCDLIVEAIVEDLALKRELFGQLDALTGPHTILASNTSALDIDAIAAATARPGSVLGLHFFHPAHVLRIIEVVPGAHTSPQTLAAGFAVCRLLGKTAILAANRDGFIGNRMLYALRREAELIVEDGASPAAVDRVLVAFGFKMGPFAVADLAGLDIGWRVRQRQYAERPPSGRIPHVADALCERGRFGQKTGAGWYRYAPGSVEPAADPLVDELIAHVARVQGIERRPIDDTEIAERSLGALVTEGRAVVADGTARCAGDVDVLWVDAYGFPAARGGPLYWSERRA